MNKSSFYTKLANQHHPECQNYIKSLSTSTEELILTPDEKDKEIAAEIVEIYNYYNKKDSSDGEWAWIDDNGRNNFIECLRSGNPENLATLLSNAFRNDATFGIISSHYEERNNKNWTHDLCNEILQDIGAWKEFSTTDDLHLKHLDSSNVEIHMG